MFWFYHAAFYVTNQRRLVLYRSNVLGPSELSIFTWRAVVNGSGWNGQKTMKISRLLTALCSFLAESDTISITFVRKARVKKYKVSFEFILPW